MFLFKEWFSGSMLVFGRVNNLLGDILNKKTRNATKKTWPNMRILKYLECISGTSWIILDFDLLLRLDFQRFQEVFPYPNAGAHWFNILESNKKESTAPQRNPSETWEKPSVEIGHALMASSPTTTCFRTCQDSFVAVRGRSPLFLFFQINYYIFGCPPAQDAIVTYRHHQDDERFLGWIFGFLWTREGGEPKLHPKEISWALNQPSRT